VSLFKGMKGRSSYHVNARRPDRGGECAWQPEYGLISFSERSLPDVIAYKENQRQHDAQHTIRSYLEHIHE